MAKSGMIELDQNPSVEVLKKELQRLVKAIVQDSSSDDETGFIDKALYTLQGLKELKKDGRKQRSCSVKKMNDCLMCPNEFRCPISKEVMKDPVVVSTGQVMFLFTFCCCNMFFNVLMI